MNGLKCKIEGCEQATAGKSRYCHEHRAEARKRFKAMVAEQAAERAHRYAEFAAIWNEAVEAGNAAGKAVNPEPMHIVGYAPIADGVCGFGWVVVYPGNCSFALWAKKNHGADAEYGGGMNVYWVHEFNQSYERKYAFAQAFAEVLRKHGIKAAGRGRLD